MKPTANKHTGSIKYPLTGDNPALGILSDSFWKRMIVQQNYSVGKLHEWLAAMVVQQSLYEDAATKHCIVSMDKKYFDCFIGGTAKRRFDIYVEELGTAYEVKAYRPRLTKFIREQIKKDTWLLGQNKIKRVQWVLFKGGSKALLETLTQCEIEYLDISSNDETFTNISKLYRDI
jgi:hypothetical protein